MNSWKVYKRVLGQDGNVSEEIDTTNALSIEFMAPDGRQFAVSLDNREVKLVVTTGGLGANQLSVYPAASNRVLIAAVDPTLEPIGFVDGKGYIGDGAGEVNAKWRARCDAEAAKKKGKVQP
jgi:hypothetical protein